MKQNNIFENIIIFLFFIFIIIGIIFLSFRISDFLINTNNEECLTQNDIEVKIYDELNYIHYDLEDIKEDLDYIKKYGCDDD